MDGRTRDNQQPISAGRFHRQGAGHDHTNANSDREPKCDTNGNCYSHCYRNRDGYTHRYCHCYGHSYRDSYSYGNRYTHCYCYSYSYTHCNCNCNGNRYSNAHGNRYSNANVDTDANTNSHSNRDAETYAHAAVSPFTKASSNSTSTVGEIHPTLLCRQMGMQPRRCGVSELLQYSQRRLIEPWLQFQIASTQRGDYKATLL
jgi:hypothetical protein